MNLTKVLDHLHITYQTEGHKHCRPGWANTACPFCTGNPGLHLGLHISQPRAYCWRCGGHPLYKTLSKLSGMPANEVMAICRQYVGVAPSPRADHLITVRRKAFKFPQGAAALQISHKKYLRGRGFIARQLEKEWGLLGTGPLGKLDLIDYRYRIIAPIIWEGKVVSFQARDITGKAEAKYKACSKDREQIHHQHILYCHPEIDWSLPIIVVEGITDVWRMGRQAVGVFGIDFLSQQVRALSKKKKQGGDDRVVILFDKDPQAIKQGEKLTAELSFRGMDCRQEIIVGDPGDMNQEQADMLVKDLMRSKWKQ